MTDACCRSQPLADGLSRRRRMVNFSLLTFPPFFAKLHVCAMVESLFTQVDNFCHCTQGHLCYEVGGMLRPLELKLRGQNIFFILSNNCCNYTVNEVNRTFLLLLLVQKRSRLFMTRFYPLPPYVVNVGSFHSKGYRSKLVTFRLIGDRVVVGRRILRVGHRKET